VGIAIGLEADDVVGEQPLGDALADRWRDRLPDRRRRHRDVREVADDRARPQAADRLGGAVQVVVVEHDPRPAVAAGLSDDCRSEGLVHGHVPTLPGAQGAGVDDRPLGKVPHLVLEEPEEGVGDDVVGLLVDGALGRNEAQTDLLVGAGCGAHEARVGGCAPVTVAHGRRDPRHGDVVTDLAEGGDEAARPATRAQRAVRAAREGHRPAVGGNDQAAVTEQLCRCGAKVRIGQGFGIG
jgi:hypothetical protein